MEVIKGLELENSLKKNSLVLSIANGNSMFPFIKNGTKILLSKPKDIKMFDVVLFKKDNHYILHRVIGINNDGYIIMGDNSLNNEYVRKDCILGLLIAYYKGDRYIEINDDINLKYYKISRKLKPIIKIKKSIKLLLKN